MRTIIPLLIAALLISACTPTTPPPASDTNPPSSSATIGDADNGRQIFTQGVNQSPPCSTCHFVAKDQTGFALGPNLAGIGEIAATRVEGMSAEEYLHQSIADPRSYIVPGYRTEMYPDYAQHFSEQDFQDLIAYLMTLEG